MVWLERFDKAFAKLEMRLRRFPTAGAELRRDERVMLRQAVFPDGLPYLVHYVHLMQERVREIWLVRLFHFAQDRPQPEPSELPW